MEDARKPRTGPGDSLANGIDRDAQPASPAPGSSSKRGARGRSSGDAISAGLRQLWANVENEPVPDDFLQMLDAIDAAKAAKSPGTGT